MDVRCESCGTEYELEESKLKAGGVTVKCASCGHMFKIRKRGTTNAGAVPPAPAPRKLDRTPAPLRMPTSGSGPNKKKRTWLIRREDGEVVTCQELAKLQQWIVEGQVSRESQISRNGKTWKPLGDITELAMFFDVADEARRARSSSGPMPEAPRAGAGAPGSGRVRQPTQPPPPPRPAGSSPPERAPRASTQPPPPPAPAAAAPVPEPQTIPAEPPAAAAIASRLDALGSAPPKPAGAPSSGQTSSPAGKPVLASDDRATGSWAAVGKQSLHVDDDGGGPSGPVGGFAKGVPTADVAFAKSGKPGLSRVPSTPPSDLDEEMFSQRKGGAGLWIALGSLLVIGGALAVVYLFVFRDSGGESGATEQPVAAAGQDAGPIAESLADGSSSAGADDSVAAARAGLLGDSQLVLEDLSERLAASSDTSVEMLALRSRIESALAQHLMDEALVAGDDGEARKLRRAAKTRIDAAQKLAEQALDADAANPAANIAMADAERLAGKKRAHVARLLRKAGEGQREALYVEALLDIREGKRTSGVRQLRKLGADAEQLGDVRPAYRLALLDVADKKYDQARDGANKVLTMQAGHPGATALLSRIDAATTVVTSDPMPPEKEADHDDDGTSRSSGSSRGSSGGGGGSYDSLLSRADKKAESGDCKQAMGLYQRALDVNPVGVAALTGLGYCHIDAKQFASAFAKFRAALSISPRYQNAMLGVAEAYQQQGLKKQAVEAYKKFLAEHPSSSRAEMVKRQIERLGGGTGGSAGSGAGSTGGGTSGTGDGEGGGTKTDGSDSSGAETKPEGSKPAPSEPAEPADKPPPPSEPAGDVDQPAPSESDG